MSEPEQGVIIAETLPSYFEIRPGVLIELDINYESFITHPSGDLCLRQVDIESGVIINILKLTIIGPEIKRVETVPDPLFFESKIGAIL